METKHSPAGSAKYGWLMIPAILLVAGVAIGWWFLRDRRTTSASPEDIERFYVGISALDVEANERALPAFKELSQTLPNEPAVWANLAIAQLRLNAMPEAVEALAKAVELAPDNSQIKLLQALAQERSGAIEQSIQTLKQIPNPDPAALYMLASLVERTGSDTSPQERLDLINRILEQLPQNAVAQFQRARLAARLNDAAQLNDSLQSLSERQGEWNDFAKQQFESAKKAAADGQFNEAAKFLTFLENVSKPLPSYREGLLALGVTGGSAGTPLREFLVVPAPRYQSAEPDRQLTFQAQPIADDAGQPRLLRAAALSGDRRISLLNLTGNQLRVGESSTIEFPSSADSHVGPHAVLPVDLNADFRPELVLAGSTGLAIHLQQQDGTFQPRTPTEAEQQLFKKPSAGVWAIDFDADGDLDLLVTATDNTSQLIRNNGDMTFTAVDAFKDLPAPRDLHWVDLDNDGDVDVATLDKDGRLQLSWNERSGNYSTPLPLLEGVSVTAFAVGDINLDGGYDVVALDDKGTVHRIAWDGLQDKWNAETITEWDAAPDLKSAFAEERVSLWLGDLDNNGATDLVTSTGQTAVWLNDSDARLTRLELHDLAPIFVTSLADMNADGHLDLIGIASDGGRVAAGRGTKNYHWQVTLPRGNSNAGDQRINSFGIGGRIEVRAGRLLQAAPIISPVVHFGLGEHRQAAVARIVWPNGTVQAEFDLQADQTASAQQRLKGSCPFVFTRNENGLVFVKDFIWRSPLGLKINSQDTAGVLQTEDWIKIPGESLTAKDGVYEVRITAELWETHFFDHISLLAVDHPESVEAFVDERFIATRSPALEIVSTTAPRALAETLDEQGRDISAELSVIDGRYVDSFQLGRFQGVAAEHWIEFRLDADVPTDRPLFVIGHGWVYPTDSSLNVAMSQGDFPRPHGFVLEVPEADGSWKAVSDDLGFPAGKNKTVLIPLPEDLVKAGQRHFRLRTNLEVYLDFLGWVASAGDVKVETKRAETKLAELRYRGFSELSTLDRRKPDIPNYGRVVGIDQRWRDLEGFYTRFGDIRELLETVDDRYLIMNAGDEILLHFAALDPPPKGWGRDFVLVGDGWVKDGDYNTTFSRTVHPLPTHADADYSAGSNSLFDDPTFRKHFDDWRRFHTRYVTPHRFARGLWPSADSR